MQITVPPARPAQKIRIFFKIKTLFFCYEGFSLQKLQLHDLRQLLSITILSLFFITSAVEAQPKLSFDMKKPPKFENRTLGSEKTATKKFTAPRRFMQNTITHYNYYFNASTRLNEVLAKAKAQNRDDYTKLLPFYNYSLRSTASFRQDLDSVIYKSTAGVLLHDLRNDWVDNLYLLIGKAYYLRNDLDSAYLTFQYVNFTFSPKEKDGYDKVIGSNQEEGSAFSISTKENSSPVKSILSRPPSRNESLVWQVRTFIARDEFAEAGSLIETLKHDPQFPDRLVSELEEMQAWLFYKQSAYDSAAVHLEKALGNASGNVEKSRWEYLIAQLYEKAGKTTDAKEFYERTIRHTLDPLMEVYARLNAIRQDRNGTKEDIDAAVANLVKMARKDRYVQYRDIIFYTAAIIELERNQPEAAKALLARSVQFSSTQNADQKSRSYLALGDIFYGEKDFVHAKTYYDSVELSRLEPESAKILGERKPPLALIVRDDAVIERQDSLARIAAMPEQEREDFVRKLFKKIRKQQGLQEEDGTGVINNPLAGTAAPDLFTQPKGSNEWYFANAAAKAKGFSDFKSRWGNRPNVDNWRRQTAIVQPNTAGRNPGMNADLIRAMDVSAPMELTYESMIDRLPLTPEKQKIAADSVEHSWFDMGKQLMNGLEEYAAAARSFETLLDKFPATKSKEEALFDLVYCYSKLGRTVDQARVKQLLTSNFPGGKFASRMGAGSLANSPDSIAKTKATRQYENVYTQFIEGRFQEAMVAKRLADSVYGQNYWTPQLLYIEAIYHIKEREDSSAKDLLNKIMQRFPSSPMYFKSANLLSVLSRRKEIEDYLNKLEIERPEKDAPIASNNLQKPSSVKPEAVVKTPANQQTGIQPKTSPAADSAAIAKAKSPFVKDTVAAVPRVKKDTVAVKPPVLVKKDTVATPPVIAKKDPVVVKKDSVVTPPVVVKKDSAAVPTVVAKKDSVTVPPVVARRDSIATPPIVKRDSVAKPPVVVKKDSVSTAPVIAKKDSVAKPPVVVKKDSVATPPLIAKKDSAAPLITRKDTVATPPVVAKTTKTDSVKVAKPLEVTVAGYTSTPAAPHLVVLILDKVDPVYATEARNAFNRFNRERYLSRNIEVTGQSLTDDLKLVVLRNFENATVALDYVENTKKFTKTDIIPWLTPTKYSFVIITEQNLEKLKAAKDLTGYRQFLNAAFPGKF